MRPADGNLWMARVAALPCVVCQRPGPSIVHHCIMGRFSQRRRSDFATIPLCWDHHDAQSPDGLHHRPALWSDRWGRDIDFLPVVRAMIEMP